METAKREMTFLLADPERRLLRAIAKKLPVGIRSNHLTGLGVFGAVGAGAAYALSGASMVWLWVASAMLIVNWFGDSLDGTLARVRGAERPKYGYYLDHFIDAFSTAAVGVGVGLSPYVHLELALVLVVIYLTLSINVYLESAVFGVFKMAYGMIGPTEGRILLISGNALLVVGTSMVRNLEQLLFQVTNLAVLSVGVCLVGGLTVRFGRNLHRLAKLEPRSTTNRV